MQHEGRYFEFQVAFVVTWRIKQICYQNIAKVLTQPSNPPYIYIYILKTIMILRFNRIILSLSLFIIMFIFPWHCSLGFFGWKSVLRLRKTVSWDDYCGFHLESSHQSPLLEFWYHVSIPAFPCLYFCLIKLWLAQPVYWPTS